MSDVIDFQKEAIGRLRARVAELDGANDSLLAVTRGHRGAAAMVHRAVLAALDADGLDHLVHVIIADWVDILGLDVIVLALESGRQHIRMGTGGIRFLAPQIWTCCSRTASVSCMATASTCSARRNPPAILCHDATRRCRHCPPACWRWARGRRPRSRPRNRAVRLSGGVRCPLRGAMADDNALTADAPTGGAPTGDTARGWRTCTGGRRRFAGACNGCRLARYPGARPSPVAAHGCHLWPDCAQLHCLSGPASCQPGRAG